jgi:hypothetical protein
MDSSTYAGQLQDLELWHCHFRVKCEAAGCTNQARVIVGRLGRWRPPRGQRELCNRAEVESAKAKGLAVHPDTRI